LLAIVMLRVTRLLLLIGAAALILTATAQARATARQTVKLRVAVPAAGDLSVLSFEMSIGGEGRRHRKQAVNLRLINHKQPGVFAVARLRPEPGHPGRFLGVVEVFHRKLASTAVLPAGLQALAHASPLTQARAAMGAYDEFIVRARNERVIKRVIKTNIVALASAHMLGPDEFCEPSSHSAFLLGNAVIGAAYLLAGTVSGLPAGVLPGQLADDAVYELCDEAEDYQDSGYEDSTDEEDQGGIEVMLVYLGAIGSTSPPPLYHVGFMGAWAFEGPYEVKLSGTLIGSSIKYVAHAADSTNPVDAIRVVLPVAGTTPRKVTNYICPSQLPTAAVISTNSPSDTLMCSGGSLAINQQFALNVRSNPPPSTGMGGQLWVRQDGAYLAPFSFTGP
jgi:hypothetical protein